MSNKPPLFRAHFLVGIALGLVALIVLGAAFLQRVLAWLVEYHHIGVFCFLGTVTIWTYWAVFALVTRRIERNTGDEG